MNGLRYLAEWGIFVLAFAAIGCFLEAERRGE